jgi:hypothetical protein
MRLRALSLLSRPALELSLSAMRKVEGGAALPTCLLSRLKQGKPRNISTREPDLQPESCSRRVLQVSSASSSLQGVATRVCREAYKLLNRVI